jgi:hypothetical protein
VTFALMNYDCCIVVVVLHGTSTVLMLLYFLSFEKETEAVWTMILPMLMNVDDTFFNYLIFSIKLIYERRQHEMVTVQEIQIDANWYFLIFLETVVAFLFGGAVCTLFRVRIFFFRFFVAIWLCVWMFTKVKVVIIINYTTILVMFCLLV